MAPPKGGSITPGVEDIEQGSDAATERPAWSSSMSWSDVGKEAALGLASGNPVVAAGRGLVEVMSQQPAAQAAFRQDNTIGAFFAQEPRDTAREPDFNPWDTIRGTPYEANWNSFVSAHNPREAERIKRKIDREKEDRKLLDGLPWYQSLPLQMSAGVADWPTLLPGGAFVRGAQGGISISRSAMNVALAAGASTAAQEATLQSIEETRPLSESVVNIGASVFLGGLLGAGGAKLLSNAEWSRGVDALARELGDFPSVGTSPDALRPAPHRDADGFGFAINPGREAPDDGDRIISRTEFRPYGPTEKMGSKTLSVSDEMVAKADIIQHSDGNLTIQKIETLPAAQRRGYASALVRDLLDEFPDAQIRTSMRTDDGSAFFRNAFGSESGSDPIIRSSGGVPTSAGAAAVTARNLADNAIAGRAAGAVAAATRFNPLLRALHSPSAAWREIATKLVENPLYLKKNFEGVASEPAVETLMKEWNAGLAKSVMQTDAAFAEHRKAGGQMKHLEFREAVGKAMRRGDVDDDPHVAKVAQTWRSQVFDPLKEAAIKAGLLKPDVSVETAVSYFSRMWNRNKLIQRESEFKGIVQKWVDANLPRWAGAYDADTERAILPLRQELADLEMAKLRRAEELKARQEGGEIEAGDLNEADIRSAIRIVEGGAPRPKGVQTLTQFVAAAGGLVDFSGELATRGINNKARPGFVRAQRKRAQDPSGGWSLDDMARHAWESGYFPEHPNRISIDTFLDALQDDFFKVRAVVRHGDKDAFRLQELVDRLDADLARVGVSANDKRGARFSTSEEVKGIVSRVYQALDAQADEQAKRLKAKLNEREAARGQEREARFLGDPNELGREIADEVFDTLTGKTVDGPRPEFITVKARGPLKERTFNIPDKLVEDFLEHDIDMVGRRYARIMGADVEIANKFGSVDMVEQIQAIRDSYRQLRSGITNEKQLKELGKREASDVKDLESLRDILRGSSIFSHPVEQKYSSIVRSFNHLNYIRSMGEVALASLTETIRPAMVHGLMPYMGFMGSLATNLKGIKLSVAEAQLAGNVLERVLGHRLATIAEVVDPYASRGPMEAFLENMTNVASKWNGIRLLTDMQKAAAVVLTQNRILDGASRFNAVKASERAYLNFLGVDESMAGRIAKQFASHGETVEGVRVANTEAWTDPVARRTYRAAVNKDADSIITTKGVADVPLLANTPTGRALLQFKTFFLASHQRVLLRGLQESQARFVGGLVAMTGIGMMVTYLKAISGNREEKLADFAANPGWWISEGLDKSGIFSVPMELSNTFEKATGLNPIKSPIKLFDEGSRLSQRTQNRSSAGALLGPTIGFGDDLMTAAGIPGTLLKGEKEVTQGQKNAAERLLPFNSYLGMRQMLRHVVNPAE